MLEPITVAVLVVIVVAILQYRIYKNRDQRRTSEIVDQIHRSEQLKQTLAMGLYYRFNHPTKKDKDGNTIFANCSSSFLKNTPDDFEQFVSEVFEDFYGGSAFKTVSSGDNGVDIEHRRDNELYLGQVKCYKNDLSYEPIALIHSNIVKRGAVGGFVVTTSGFSKNAKAYAHDLGIELIDGVKFVEMWIESLGKRENALFRKEMQKADS